MTGRHARPARRDVVAAVDLHLDAVQRLPWFAAGPRLPRRPAPGLVGAARVDRRRGAAPVPQRGGDRDRRRASRPSSCWCSPSSAASARPAVAAPCAADRARAADRWQHRRRGRAAGDPGELLVAARTSGPRGGTETGRGLWMDGQPVQNVVPVRLAGPAAAGRPALRRPGSPAADRRGVPLVRRRRPEPAAVERVPDRRRPRRRGRFEERRPTSRPRTPPPAPTDEPTDRADAVRHRHDDAVRRADRDGDADQVTQNPHPLTGQPFPSPVPPGTGWPEDPAAPGTPVAHDAADVARLAAGTDARTSSSRGSRCAAPARGWWSGGRTSRRPGGAATPVSRTGAGRCRAGATRRRGCSSSAWRRRRTAATGPAACSPATAPVTGSSPRSTAPGSAARPGAPTPATAWR